MCVFCPLISPSCRRENIAPDYPLTLLEGLTTITHYCLLDNRKVRNDTYTHTFSSFMDGWMDGWRLLNPIFPPVSPWWPVILWMSVMHATL